MLHRLGVWIISREGGEGQRWAHLEAVESGTILGGRWREAHDNQQDRHEKTRFTCWARVTTGRESECEDIVRGRGAGGRERVVAGVDRLGWLAVAAP